ncbi:MAG: sulfopyruvate decarboxylase subunit alpha [Chloroflexi bacterium]|nr:sulfopyruvate decarboxylase subunit alpha [Chloroflexota bacterium]
MTLTPGSPAIVQTIAEQSPSTLIKDELVRQGFQLIVSYPDHRMAFLQRELQQEPSWRYLPIAREEEGIGICAGAFCGGMKALLIMPNSGFLTCCNAINGIALLCGIPVLMLVSWRGSLGEKRHFMMGMGKVTPPVMDALGMDHFVLEKPEQLGLLGEAYDHAVAARKPVAVLIMREMLRGRGGAMEE